MTENGRTGLIIDPSFNMQFHTIDLKELRFNEHSCIGLILIYLLIYSIILFQVPNILVNTVVQVLYSIYLSKYSTII